ncbi:MAG: phosphotransferase [Gammaproteobacteria bacterium]|nr:phosphotransferase [Gammaproteobacteria bacterium]
MFFRASWHDAGQHCSARYVARIALRMAPVYPRQTATAMASVDLQYRVMQAVGRGGVPVPPLLGYEESTELLGAPFYVMGFVDGEVPKDNPIYTSEGFLVDGEPRQRYRAIDDGLSVLARLHAIDPGAAGLDWLAGGANSAAGLPGRDLPALCHRTARRTLASGAGACVRLAGARIRGRWPRSAAVGRRASR